MKKIFSIICLVLGIAACTDEQVGPQTPSTNETRIVNGMLVFNSSRDLTQAIENARDLPANSYVYNFTSKQDLLENIIKEERKNMDVLDTLEGEALAKAPKHSSTYQKALENGIIKEIHYTDGSTSYDLNLCLPAYSKVINEEGFFAINDTIFQVTGDKVKIWRQGNPHNKEVLSLAETSDNRNNIIIYDFSNISTNQTSRSISFPAPPTNIQVGASCNWYGTEERQATVFYDKTGIADSEHYIRDLYVRVFGQEKIKGTNSYNYKSFPFQLSVTLQTDINNVIEDKYRIMNYGRNSDQWYTIYPMFKLLSEGKIQQKTDEPYAYILYFWVIMNPLAPNLQDLHGQVEFSLRRAQKTHTYEIVLDHDLPYNPNGIEGTYWTSWLEEIPAE